jgi:hypothetical protein
MGMGVFEFWSLIGYSNGGSSGSNGGSGGGGGKGKGGGGSGDTGDGNSSSKLIYDKTFKRPGAVPLDMNVGYQWATYLMKLQIWQKGNQLLLTANSKHSWVAGKVVPSASATLIVDGKEMGVKTFSLGNNETDITQTGGFYPVGNVNFVIPASGNVSIRFEGGWNVYMPGGGAAVPVYHPLFFPFSININQTIKIH